jgi:hypothetical protein
MSGMSRRLLESPPSSGRWSLPLVSDNPAGSCRFGSWIRCSGGYRRAVLVSIGLACLGAGAAATSAVAAPSLGVGVTHSPSNIARGDERAAFAITVRNTATVSSGEALTCASGTWANNPTAFTFEWLRNATPILGAQTNSYTVTPADAGAVLQCVVKGTNAGGGSITASRPTIVVAPAPQTAPPDPPSFNTAPAGTSSLTCSPGTWTGSPTFSYQWLRNGTPIANATTSTYAVQPADAQSVLQCEITGMNAGGAAVAITANKLTTPPPSSPAPSPPSAGPSVTGTSWTTGAVAVTMSLPSGMRALTLSGGGWTCTAMTLSCTRSTALAPGGAFAAINLVTAIDDAAPDAPVIAATASGGGASVDAQGQESFTFTPRIPFGLATFTTIVTDAAGTDYTQAGGHPFQASTSFTFATHKDAGGNSVPVEHVRRVVTDLPPGFVGNPQSLPAQCVDVNSVTKNTCPLGSVVGGVSFSTTGAGLPVTYQEAVFSIKPERGVAAEFAFEAGLVNVYVLKARVRSDGDYGITIDAPLVTERPEILGIDLTFCGYGSNVTRFIETNFVSCKPASDPTANPQPFLTNPTECSSEAPLTTMSVESWEHRGDLRSFTSVAPNVTGCGQVPFQPQVDIKATTSDAEDSSGLDVDITVPQTSDPNALATAQLDRTVVRLPEGVSVNPSAASGLEGCSDGQMGLVSTEPRRFNNQEPSCPDGSKIGSIDLFTPLLESPDGPGSPNLKGDVYLGTPKSIDPQSGQMFRLFLVLRNRERGLLVKIPGSAVADPQTGQLTATFDKNPRLPFEKLHLDLKGGVRGILAMPQTCGEKPWSAELTPWTARESAGGEAIVGTGTLSVTGCPTTRPFSPSVTAGTLSPSAGESAPFKLTISRAEGQQELGAINLTLPEGLLGKVADVPVCPEQKAAAGTCSVASMVGSVQVAAGAGISPLWVPQPGKSPTAVYLAGPYKGAPYSLSIVVPAQAGPFDLGTVVVRAALFVDRNDAHISVRSDPLPTIVKGIPLRVREIRVQIDRPGFMLNPTNCNPSQISAEITSTADAVAKVSSRFQVGECASLPFEPQLDFKLTNKTQLTDGKHPGIRAILTQRAGEAGLHQATVTLPLSLALDPDNAQSLCEYGDGLKVNCPESSAVGTVRAFTPVLDQPLVGKVYFVKGVRFNSKGQAIRTLPTLLIPLHGQGTAAGVEVDLRATSQVNGGKLVTTFANIPDVPNSRFEFNLNGGKHGIIVVTHNANVCKGNQVAEIASDGQNGKQTDNSVLIEAPCAKRPTVGKAALKRGKVGLRVIAPAAGKMMGFDIRGRVNAVTKSISKKGPVSFTLRPTRQALARAKRMGKLALDIAVIYVNTKGEQRTLPKQRVWLR